MFSHKDISHFEMSQESNINPYTIRLKEIGNYILMWSVPWEWKNDTDKKSERPVSGADYPPAEGIKKSG